MLAETGHHRLIPRATFLDRHGERPIERFDDLIDVERVDDKGSVQFTCRAGKTR